MRGGRRDSASPSWAADLRFEVFDLLVRVRCPDLVVAERISDLLRPFATEESTPVQLENQYELAEEDRLGRRVLKRGDAFVASGESWEPLIASLVTELNMAAVAEMRCFAAHAGAVYGDGVIAFPAESGGGKSTLTAACLLTGLGYVSDEALCVDLEDGSVIPYPKPIGLGRRSVDLLKLAAPASTSGEVLVTPHELGAVIAEGRLPLRHVLHLERRPGEPELVETARSDIVASLLRASFNHYKWPEQSFRLVSDLATACRSWKLRYEDPLQAARMIRERLGAAT